MRKCQRRLSQCLPIGIATHAVEKRWSLLFVFRRRLYLIVDGDAERREYSARCAYKADEPPHVTHLPCCQLLVIFRGEVPGHAIVFCCHP